ncbi:MAG TPA: enoyl-CoA hydratase/isomerase family protein, partial [Candidatus Binatia bacterium]|nr:enoyl-CoA hydratase/isomerase family protein [Candidatus Binatia bacterium]
MSLIVLERRDTLAVIRLNRPGKLNSLTREMILELSDLFRNFASDDSLRAVILTGSGEKAFCVGTDIGELSDSDSVAAQQISERGQALCNLI